MDRRCERSTAMDPKARLGLSALLVGAGDGGVDHSRSVQALLQATAQANAILAGLEGPCDRLGAVEIIELYEDRAFETWRTAKKTIEGDPALKAGFALASKVNRRDGGGGHAPIARDPNWWLPIQITMPRDTEPDRSLAFTIGGGFARAEARTIAADLDIVAPLLRRTAQNVDLDGSPTSPGRILFELLWPESLKHRSGEEQNRRLIPDERGAAFPWELMDDRRPWVADDVSGAALEPPAVRSGLVRQLLQDQASERVAAPRGAPKALVIGDPGAEPPPGFPRLPGAEAEARAIVKLLEPTHDPKLLVTRAATPEQIFKQLYGQAWEIVHMSAHGVVDHQFP
jgi:CHAT domain